MNSYDSIRIMEILNNGISVLNNSLKDINKNLKNVDEGIQLILRYLYEKDRVEKSSTHKPAGDGS